MPRPPKAIPPIEDVNVILHELKRIEARVIKPTDDKLAEVMATARALSAQADQNFIWLGEIAKGMVDAYKKNVSKDPSYLRMPPASVLLKRMASESRVSYRALNQYRGIVKFYGGAQKVFNLFRSHPALTYTHLRTAKGRRSLAEATEFLVECMKRNYSPDDAEAWDKIKKKGRIGKNSFEIAFPAKVVRFSGNQVTFEFSSERARLYVQRWFDEDAQLQLLVREPDAALREDETESVIDMPDEGESEEQES